MNKIQYCKKIQGAIKDEGKGANEYTILQMQSTNRIAIALFSRISNDERRHKMQLEHLYPKICE